MITGDNGRIAEAVARELGIERAFAEVLPAGKARYVEQPPKRASAWRWSEMGSTTPRRSRRRM